MSRLLVLIALTFACVLHFPLLSSGATIRYYSDPSCSVNLDPSEDPLITLNNGCTKAVLSEDLSSSLFTVCTAANYGVQMFFSPDCGSHMFQYASSAQYVSEAPTDEGGLRCLPVFQTEDGIKVAYVTIDCTRSIPNHADSTVTIFSVLILSLLALVTIQLQKIVL